MDFSLLAGKTFSELYKLLEERKRELFNMRIQKVTGQEFKSHRVKEVRRDVAKIITRIAQMKTRGE
ncbi:MAG: 50S ribosomal protein L29 [Holosporales bacterium]|jgi:large subunit ribosomal protein L29|nr:50S ribosomal protein L29 [Holosporales bacterium]